MITARIFTISSILLTLTLLQTNFTGVTSAPFIAEDTYPSQPNEVLPIQPIQLYPTLRGYRMNGRKLEKDNEVVYVKLLKRKGYHPEKHSTKDVQINKTPELKPKDIFYVKALANGQFSHHRIKWYRLPEFYAISVFRKGDILVPQTEL